MAIRNLSCALATLLATLWYRAPLMTLVTFASHNDIYLYSGVMPLMSACLIYRERNRIFARTRSDFAVGLALVAVALILRAANAWYSHPSLSLSLATLSFLVMWLGIFAACYGGRALRAAAFQLSLLALMVPLPAPLLDAAVFTMRTCSARVAGVLFRLGDVPVFQNGFRFSLPGLDIEVARQCSGIRSGLSFFVISLIVGHLFLRSLWGKLGLVVAAFPITVFKNGLRIVTIYGLSVHPNLAPLTTWVHRYGGIPFSFLGLLILAVLVSGLRKLEDRSPAGGRRTGATLAARETATGADLNLTCH